MKSTDHRHGLARAEFFLRLSENCSVDQLSEFEAHLEASIIFARSAIQRMQLEFKSHPKWKNWFALMANEPSINFFREERDLVLHECPTHLTQIINFNAVKRATELRRFKGADVDAASHVRGHLQSYRTLLDDADRRFRGETIENSNDDAGS